jgi:hypothetical protein
MDNATADRIEQQVREAFPEGAIARVRVLQYGDDPEVEPGHVAIRVFFEWPGRSEGGQANRKTVHQFLNAHARAFDALRDELPGAIRWVEFRPEGQAGAPSPGGLAYRITDRERLSPAGDEPPEDRTPVMVRLGPVDLATVDTLVLAGVVNSRAEGLRWALNRLREQPAYAQLQQQAHQNDEPKT